MTPAKFVLFGPDHWYSMGFTILASLLGMSAVRKFLAGPRQRDLLALVLGWIMIGYELTKAVIRPVLLNEPWQTTLPLQLCQLAGLALGLMLVLRSYRWFEIAYFWGMGGGTMTILTPDLAYGFPDPQYLMHNLTHTLIYTGVLYGLVVYGYRPTWHSVKLSFGTAAGIMVVVLPLNYLLGHGANYLFLRYRPQAGSLLDFLPPPPGHIPFVVLLAAVVYFLAYLPFWVSPALKPDTAVDRRRK